MPTTNFDMDRAEYAMAKPLCKNLYGSAAVLRSPTAGETSPPLAVDGEHCIR
jgi:hypothetical protein